MQLLIGFETGLIVLWDLREKTAEFRYNAAEVRISFSLLIMHYHSNMNSSVKKGKGSYFFQFLTCHRALERHLPYGVTQLLATRHSWERFIYSGVMEGWVVCGVSYIPRLFTCLQAITHASNNHLIATPCWFFFQWRFKWIIKVYFFTTPVLQMLWKLTERSWKFWMVRFGYFFKIWNLIDLRFPHTHRCKHNFSCTVSLFVISCELVC